MNEPTYNYVTCPVCKCPMNKLTAIPTSRGDVCSGICASQISDIEKDKKINEHADDILTETQLLI
ncbi:hypothetical protein MM5_030 [Morganella phage vB_Mm5]